MPKKSKKAQAALQQELYQHQGHQQSDEEECVGPAAGTTEGRVTLVISLEDYEGSNTEEKVDSLIKQHEVVMINRSWCLFSIDATDFLVQLGVNVYSLEIDNHAKGNKILKYLAKKCNHKTTPLIFISGKFLGGFEDVNAMYSKGTLQSNYLAGLSNREKCTKMATLSTREPLFWFPNSVNGKVVRCMGMLTCGTALVCVIATYLTSWGPYISYYLVLDFVLRILAGSKLSLLGRLATLLTIFIEPDKRAGRPKQFASMCGLVFSVFGAAFYAVGVNIVGSVFIAGLAGASGLEGFADYCLGCVFFRIGIQCSIIPK